VGRQSDDHRYNVLDRVFFEVDKADLTSRAKQVVVRWADWLKLNPSAGLTIEGHCDERGTREYNLARGERRAAAVRDYLASLGVDTRRLSTVSYGKERPEVVGSSEEVWAQNRRAVVVAHAP
jgi:peptidoglycan-associated lipoprotein